MSHFGIKTEHSRSLMVVSVNFKFTLDDECLYLFQLCLWKWEKYTINVILFTFLGILALQNHSCWLPYGHFLEKKNINDEWIQTSDWNYIWSSVLTIFSVKSSFSLTLRPISLSVFQRKVKKNKFSQEDVATLSSSKREMAATILAVLFERRKLSH